MKIIRQSKQKYYATKFKRVRDSIKDTSIERRVGVIE